MKEIKISQKAHKILGVTFFLLVIIAVKSWHLCIIQKEDRQELAKKPKRKSTLCHSNRGIIYDRFSLPVAINKICYNASIYYSDIKQLPYIKWVKEEDKKIKTYPRREHIAKISKILSKELGIDEMKIEDLIHSKASLFPHTPFVIKENISQEKYFRLRMLERDFLGICAEITSTRHYPNNKSACDIIGYLGAINKKEYLSVANEIKTLLTYLEQIKNHEEPLSISGFDNLEQIENRILELKNKSYRINDFVGKAGIEKKYEEHLRGNHGKKIFEVDINGNFLKELPESINPTSGKSLQLSISSQLQEFVESLLTIDEKKRNGESRFWDPSIQKSIPLKQPWVKGGAIVVIDPKTGQIISLASYPRFDPNDFSSNKTENIHKWLESKNSIQKIWDGKENLSREYFSTVSNNFYNDQIQLSWELFLDTILPQECFVKNQLDKIKNIKSAIKLQEDIEALLYFTGEKNASIVFDCLYLEKDNHIISHKIILPSKRENILKNLEKHQQDITPIKNRIDKYLLQIPHNKDKMLLIDLCRLSVNSTLFSDELINQVGDIDLSSYWKITKSLFYFDDFIKKQLTPLFYENFYKKWANENKRSFIKQKRKEEKEKNIKYPKPYADYLKEFEKKLFKNFWDENRLSFLITLIKGKVLIFNDNPDLLDSFYSILINHNKKLDEKNDENYLVLKNAISNLSSRHCFDFFKTIRSFSNLERPLLGKYRTNRKTFQTEQDLASSFYPQYGFGYGRSQAFRQSAPLGSLFKLITGYGALQEKYNTKNYKNINKYDLNPLTIVDLVKWDSKAQKGGSLVVGYNLNGSPLTRFYKGGRLPKSSHSDVGRIDITGALEQSSNPYFALLASEHVSSIDKLLETAKDFGFGSKTNINLPGEITGHLPKDLQMNKTGLYSFAIGQHSLVVTPLQTCLMLSSLASMGKVFKPTLLKENAQIKKDLQIPKQIRDLLFEGMDKVINGKRGNARAEAIKSLHLNKDLFQTYVDLRHQFIGKTSTAEIMYNPYILPSFLAEKYKHIWFGSISFTPKNENDKKISFDPKLWDNPELVIVIYLRYGSGGKEAAPIAAQIIKKYRELKKEHEKKL
jgi:cell division protein FtsI/penicillin-binding protein 2